MSDERLCRLEREYQHERERILASEHISWERKMRRLSDLLATYQSRKGDASRGLRSAGPAGDEGDDAA